jgi:hypothetical protein
MRRGYWLLLVALGVAASCDRPRGVERDGPLIIERYEVLQLHPRELTAAIARGDTIPMVLGGTRFLLALKPKNLVAPGCTVIQLGDSASATPCPRDLGTYAGASVDREAWSQARLSILPQGVIGAIRTEDVTWIIEPRPDSAESVPSGTVRHIAYRTSDVSGRQYFEGARSDSFSRRQTEPRRRSGKVEALREDGNERPGCDPEDRLPCTAPHGSGGTPPAPPQLVTLGVAFAADREYVGQARLGNDFVLRQAATLNLVDGMYRHEGVGTLQIMVVIADMNDRFFGSSQASHLLDAIPAAFANANLDITNPATRVARGISAAFLTSAKPPDRSDPPGVILGLSFEPGITGMAFQDLSLSVGSDVGTGGISGGPNEAQNFMVMAHELGHIYNADHDEADWFCRFFFLGCWNSARTIMWPAYTFRTSPEFSHGLIEVGHNNAQRIRTNLPTRTP